MTHSPPLGPQSTSTTGRRPLLLALGLLLCLGLAFTGWNLWTASPPPPEAAPAGWRLTPLAAESSAQKAAAVVRAFTVEEPCANPEQLLELARFFGGLDRAALDAGTEGSPAGGAVDYERLYQEALRHGVLSEAQVAIAESIRQDMIPRLVEDGPGHLGALASVDRFAHALIVRVEAAPGGAAGEVLVYLRRFDPTGNCGKERWWCAQKDGRWRIYDYENLYTSQRYSQYIAYLLKDAQEGRSSPVAGLIHLRGWLEQGQPAAVAVTELEKLTPEAQAPTAVRALALYCQGLLFLQADQPAKAQTAAAAALAAQPDFAAARYLLGDCHNRAAQYEQALVEAERLDAQLGRDPWAAELRATAWLGLDRAEGLAAQFEIILEHKPTDAAALASLVRASAPEQRGAALARYAALLSEGDAGSRPAADAVFHQLASDAIESGDAAGLEQLLAARRRGLGLAAPATGTPTAEADWGDDLTVLYQVKLLQLREQWQPLQEYVAAALPHIRDLELRDLIRDNGLRAAAPLKQAVAAYRAAADATAAFRVLCEALRARGDVEGLAELILAHHAGHPEDLWIHFYAGVRGLLQGDYGRAEAHFAQAVEKAEKQAAPGETASRALFRSYWLSAAYHADRGLQAFDACSDKPAAFAQLKRYYLEDGRDELLEMLIERYRPLAREDPEFFLALADIAFLTGQYQAAIDQLTAVRARLEAGSPEQRFEMHDCLMRSLIRQKQFVMAAQELQTVTDPKQEAFLAAMLAAREGKIDATAVALRHCVKAGFTPAMIYGDVDLGPALMGPEMQAALGREFPPPPGTQAPPPTPPPTPPTGTPATGGAPEKPVAGVAPKTPAMPGAIDEKKQE